MSRRPKLEMEETYRSIIPEPDRLGTRFVFRQGSPLVPDNLRRVAATTASSLIVIGDSSRRGPGAWTQARLRSASGQAWGT